MYNDILPDHRQNIEKILKNTYSEHISSINIAVSPPSIEFSDFDITSYTITKNTRSYNNRRIN